MGITKEHRLKSRTDLTCLMSDGARLKAYPVHMVFLQLADAKERKTKLKIALSAPKRLHRHAVDRNAIKRQLREAFRPFIPELEAFIEETGTACACMLIYVSREKLSQEEIELRINELCSRFKQEYIASSTDEQTQADPPQA